MDIKKYLIDFYVDTNGKKITPELAKILVDDMAVTDGTARETGEKWSMSEAREAGDRAGVDFDRISPAEWYLVLNMMYSDYCAVGYKHGFTDPAFYAELASAWFDDIDAQEDKTFNYFFN